MTIQARILTVFAAALALVVSTVFPPIVAASFASTSLSYDFNTSGTLAANFNSYVGAGSITEVATGGLNNSGAINVPSGSAGVFTTKTSYSMGPVGSVYDFVSYMYIDGSNGYGGMGFTANSTPSVSNTSSSSGPLVPNDALGISVHGGGFIFHNGGSAYTGVWTSNSNSAPVSAGHTATSGQLLNTNPWWKVFFKVTRQSATTFDLLVEVRPTDTAGVVNASADYAIMSANGVTSNAIANAASINTYFNFSMDRVRYFDNYQVSLAGGSSVIAAGAPVVLTGAASDASNVVTVNGNVTGTGGASVTERGIVYSTTTSPTVADSKLPVGSGTGPYAGTTPALPNGTYYFRAYATNSTGTSYGTEEQLTLASLASTPVVSSPATPPATELALTGSSPIAHLQNFSLAFMAIVSGVGLTLMSRSRRPIRYKKMPQLFGPDLD